MSEIQDILEKAQAGNQISADEALQLADYSETAALQQGAAVIRDTGFQNVEIGRAHV